MTSMSLEEISLLSFEEKRTWFKNGLELLRIPWTEGADYVRADKMSLLESSVETFCNCNLFKVMRFFRKVLFNNM